MLHTVIVDLPLALYLQLAKCAGGKSLPAYITSALVDHVDLRHKLGPSYDMLTLALMAGETNEYDNCGEPATDGLHDRGGDRGFAD